LFSLGNHNLESLCIVFDSAHPLAQAGSGERLFAHVLKVEIFFFGVLLDFFQGVGADIFFVEFEKFGNKLGIV